MFQCDQIGPGLKCQDRMFQCDQIGPGLKCQVRMFQCDQIGPCLKCQGDRYFLTKVARLSVDFLGYLKSKNCCG